MAEILFAEMFKNMLIAAAISNPCHVQYYFQSSDECWCGNREVRRHEWSNRCTENCTGDSTQKCGGFYCNSVFRTGMKEVNPGC